ncbi:hypothetical protein ANCCAN_11560 [Ancylostoma caninum]|uniref:Uncharacterized protein n=1 Tax=Ancylostoma caninum TaxID=29170 RepID=A0A368GDJ5_ANCCA|nr:hypothetical protein ANCCAN_11560 [Ancylostoma caninum]
MKISRISAEILRLRCMLVSYLFTTKYFSSKYVVVLYPRHAQFSTGQVLFSRQLGCISGSGLKTVSLQQFSVSDLSGTLGNLISSVTSVAGMPLNGVLPLETLTASSSECPMECLTTLTAYADKLQGNIFF